MNYKNKSFLTKKKAFTLIELLIVIAIIGILFIVLVSKVDFATDKAKATGVQTDFRSFQMAFDTVAKENAGFNTFGWDTGDLNHDGIRNSYDAGDTNKDGIQNGTEVFTGRKVYAETFTKIYSLKKAKADGTLETNYDRDALNRLEAAINANLDPKLHITIADDGTISMANGAQDPWKTEYHGAYISNAEIDGKDRGAIVLYSNGANNTFGSEHNIEDGLVTITVPGSNKAGKDDYSIVSLYTYTNGYGEVKNITTGFSNNQTLLGGNSGSVNIETPNEPNSIQYDMLNGNNQTITTPKDVVFCSAAPIDKFSHVLINNERVNESQYVVSEGPTVISINQSYIETLNNGKYTIQIISTDGYAEGVFNICVEANTPDDSSPIPFLYNTAYYAYVDAINAEIAIIIQEEGSLFFLALNGMTDKFYYTSCSDGTIALTVEEFGTLHLQTMNTSSTLFCPEINARLVATNQIVVDGDYAYIERSELGGYAVTALDEDKYAYSAIKTTINNKPVVAIADNAFGLCKNVTSIVIPEGIKYIGRFAFEGCESLKYIMLPQSLLRIDEYAFSGCKSMEEITIPDLVDSIDSIFVGCQGVKKIYIGKSVNYISSAALVSMTHLEELVVSPENVTFRSVDNCLIDIDAKTIIKGCYNSIIPNDGSVTTIGHMAFSDTYKLVNLVLPDSITTLEYGAFQKCPNLESIYFGAGFVETKMEFWQCPNIAYIEVSEDNPQYYSVNNCLINRNQKRLVLGSINSVIPDDGSVTSIGVWAFRNRNITTITIPEGVTFIDDFAFAECENLVEIILPSSMKHFGYSAFVGLQKLSTIIFGGTIDEWNEIYKDSGSNGGSWNDSLPAQYVQCLDGKVNLK